jgi:hypothetical protein
MPQADPSIRGAARQRRQAEMENERLEAITKQGIALMAEGYA